MNIRQFITSKERREAIEKERNVLLPNIGSVYIDEEIAATKNCENMIGVAMVPMGIAGPLKLTTHSSPRQTWLTQPTTHEYYLPLATTEGALVASVNRGCKAITACSGAAVFVERVGVTRGPVFETESLVKSMELKKWIEENQQIIDHIAKATSSHIALIGAMVDVVGPTVFVRFAFDTKDAMGMNMVTRATQAICEHIERTVSVHFVSVSGNYCVDKKPAWINSILGRGFRAWSEVLLPTTIVTTILKTTVDELIKLWETKCLLGGMRSGAMGFNGHAANVIAALYLATGQDIAHVVEGSSAITTMRKEADGVFVNVSIPSIMVGTVGGGTQLATQKEALSILGLFGGNDGKNAETLAGIIAGAVLAGEVSELSALANQTLTQAHNMLGRREK